MLKHIRKIVLALLVIGFVAVGLTACDDPQATPAEQAQAARNAGVAQIRTNQPAQAMDYSPTIDTINGWSATWGKKGKVSYVYMQRADGSFAGYYVLKGLPVSYCASGSPTYDYVDIKGDGIGHKVQVPAPGLDGAYYGGSGNCNRYYGFDAVTGQYVEYTDGLVLTAVLSDSPLPMDKQPTPYGSSIEDVKKAGK